MYILLFFSTFGCASMYLIVKSLVLLQNLIRTYCVVTNYGLCVIEEYWWKSTLTKLGGIM